MYLSVATVDIGPGQIVADLAFEPMGIVAPSEFLSKSDHGRRMSTETDSETAQELAERNEMEESVVIQRTVGVGDRDAVLGRDR